MITVYGTGCPKCKVLEKKLTMAGVQFNMVTDEAEVLAKANEFSLKEMPFVIKDGELVKFMDAMKMANSCDSCKIGD